VDGACHQPNGPRARKEAAPTWNKLDPSFRIAIDDRTSERIPGVLSTGLRDEPGDERLCVPPTVRS
jgi:hypothetical protein